VAYLTPFGGQTSEKSNLFPVPAHFVYPLPAATVFAHLVFGKGAPFSLAENGLKWRFLITTVHQKNSLYRGERQFSE